MNYIVLELSSIIASFVFIWFVFFYKIYALVAHWPILRTALFILPRRHTIAGMQRM